MKSNYEQWRFSMAVDPVCEMDIDEEKAAGRTEYEGKTYYFCSPGCKEKFVENPEEYIGD